MEEKTRSKSPDARDDYRTSAIADSTSGGRNAPIISVAYRQINDDTTNMPASTGYVNGGQSINYRPRLDEPAVVEMACRGGEGPVNLEVDFDNKVTDAYAKLDDVRGSDNYHMASAVYLQHSPERQQNSMNPVYSRGGMVNNSKKEKKQACKMCCLHACLAILIVTNVLGLLMGGFNLANTYNGGTITAGTPSATSPVKSDQGLREMVLELQQELSDLRRNYSFFIRLHASNISDVNSRLVFLESELLEATPSTGEMPTDAMSNETMSNKTNTTSTISPYISIPLYENCTITLQTVCTTDPYSTTSLPTQTFQYCRTRDIPDAELTNEDGYATEVFCSVDNTQLKPVSSSLRYKNGEWSCICQGLEILHFFENPLTSFDCEMYIKRCPSAISVPRN